MKNYRQCESGSKVSGLAGSMKMTCLMVLLVLPLFFAAVDAEAAHITFEPNGATISATPGEMVSVPVAATLSGASLPNAYASFSLAQTDGDLERTWVNGQAYLSLNSWYKTRKALLRINVPASAAGGKYTGVFSTMGLRSNEQVEPVSFVLNVDVEADGCNQSPDFSEILSSDDAIHTPNNKMVAVELSGSVDATAGCSIVNVWYQLTDEYDELEQTDEPVEINADGAFNVSVPMIASRKGDDKDGRLYTVIFTAENEAGLSESAETRFIVSHDNGKKGTKDKK